MKPVNGWIVVKKIERAKQTPGGIYIPDEVNKNDKIQRSEVIAISDDVLRACEEEKRELPYKVGDIIISHSQTGIELVPLNKDDNTMFMKFDGVMGVE